MPHIDNLISSVFPASGLLFKTQFYCGGFSAAGRVQVNSGQTYLRSEVYNPLV